MAPDVIDMLALSEYDWMNTVCFVTSTYKLTCRFNGDDGKTEQNFEKAQDVHGAKITVESQC